MLKSQYLGSDDSYLIKLGIISLIGFLIVLGVFVWVKKIDNASNSDDLLFDV